MNRVFEIWADGQKRGITVTSSSGQARKNALQLLTRTTANKLDSEPDFGEINVRELLPPEIIPDLEVVQVYLGDGAADLATQLLDQMGAVPYVQELREEIGVDPVAANASLYTNLFGSQSNQGMLH